MKKASAAAPVGTDSEEQHEPAGDVDTAVVGALKRLTRIGRLEKQTEHRLMRATLRSHSTPAASTVHCRSTKARADRTPAAPYGTGPPPHEDQCLSNCRHGT